MLKLQTTHNKGDTKMCICKSTSVSTGGGA
nr:MAG TPA: hypothetical protein [Caudoviricetes sp.]